jgi:hypothetical protein
MHCAMRVVGMWDARTPRGSSVQWGKEQRQRNVEKSRKTWLNVRRSDVVVRPKCLGAGSTSKICSRLGNHQSNNLCHHGMAEERLSHNGKLPQTDAYVELSLLDGGSFIGDLSKVHAGASGKYRMYNWAFYISHQGRHLLWDLGLDDVRSDLLSKIHK